VLRHPLPLCQPPPPRPIPLTLFFAAMSTDLSAIPSYTLAQALAVVFGTPPFGVEYTTEHVGKVLGHEVAEAKQLANSATAQQQGSVVVVTYEKQQSRVLGRKFSIKGEEITAEALGKNKAAFKHLVESKSGLLVPIGRA
jgi:hypothetical protein